MALKDHAMRTNPTPFCPNNQCRKASVSLDDASCESDPGFQSVANDAVQPPHLQIRIGQDQPRDPHWRALCFIDAKYQVAARRVGERRNVRKKFLLVTIGISRKNLLILDGFSFGDIVRKKMV
jgi:hypothetical protein